MGRLVGIPFFHSDAALSEEKADSSAIRRAKNCSADLDVVTQAVQECQATIALRMQGQFEGRILRRTGESVDWRDQPLISLPPYEETMVIVTPTAREMDILSVFSDDVKERYV